MEEDLRHDGGPLEKPHVRELIQKNLLENTHFEKKTKCIETAKKALIKTCSRDEFEMRLSLQKLQLEKQNILDEDAAQFADSDEDFETEPTDEDSFPLQVCEWNPYPVTIVPKFGGVGQGSMNKAKDGHLPNSPTSDTGFDDHYGNHISSSSSMGTLGETPQRRATFLQHDLHEDWVGNPSAILSVRRPRKSVSEQVHKNLLMRSHSELNSLKDRESTPSPTRSTSSMSTPRSRSNSFNSTTGSTSHSRTGSLKENHSGIDKTRGKPVARSFSMLSRLTLKEIENENDHRRLARKSSKEELVATPRLKKGGPNHNDSSSGCTDGDREHARKDVSLKTKPVVGFSSSLDENALRSLGPRRKHVYKPTAMPANVSSDISQERMG